MDPEVPENAKQAWKDALDLVRYAMSENEEATRSILDRYNDDVAATQTLYSVMVALNMEFAKQTSAARGISVEAVLDEIRRRFPGET